MGTPRLNNFKRKKKSAAIVYVRPGLDHECRPRTVGGIAKDIDYRKSQGTGVSRAPKITGISYEGGGKFHS